MSLYRSKNHCTVFASTTEDTGKRSGHRRYAITTKLPTLRHGACEESYGWQITRIWKTGVVITRKYSVITIQLYLHIRVALVHYRQNGKSVRVGTSVQ